MEFYCEPDTLVQSDLTPPEVFTDKTLILFYITLKKNNEWTILSFPKSANFVTSSATCWV